MKREIITIDESLCNGCGLCVTACHEGAIQMVAGKARLVSESYCDGLGDCLPACPTGAITIEQRSAAVYNESAVQAHLAAKPALPVNTHQPDPQRMTTAGQQNQQPLWQQPLSLNLPAAPKTLQQWPIQIKLVSPNAPFLRNAHLLIAATCSAFSYAAFHNDFVQDKPILIGCPKLDGVDYAEKLTDIFTRSKISSVTVVQMKVACCSGLTMAVKRALQQSGLAVPLLVHTLGTDGTILS